jgi:hypothetical protein
MITQQQVRHLVDKYPEHVLSYVEFVHELDLIASYDLYLLAATEAQKNLICQQDQEIARLRKLVQQQQEDFCRVVMMHQDKQSYELVEIPQHIEEEISARHYTTPSTAVQDSDIEIFTPILQHKYRSRIGHMPGENYAQFEPPKLEEA